MKIMGKKLHLNSMVVKILATVMIGILFAVISVSAIVIHISEDIFVDTYGKSQERVFLQIEEDLNNFHENLNKIIDALDASWAFRLYLSDQELDSQLAFQTIYEMNQDLREAIPSNVENISVMVIGVNGRSYLNREETIILPESEILESEISRRALEQAEGIVYQYADVGFTSTTRNSPVIMATKALRYRESREPYAIVYITMKESDWSKFYGFFTSEYANFYMVDANEQIISSDRKEKLCKKAAEVFPYQKPEEGFTRSTAVQENQHVILLTKQLPYYNDTICGVIDTKKALGRLYNIPQLWIICVLVAAAVVLVTFWAVAQTTKPLSALTQKMADARKKHYDEHIEITGSEEIQQLGRTYNSMLDELNRYIGELMHTQKEKRKAEISALQMQINPHYVYNTLASIKWMIYQGEVEKSTRAIDAFISLLRNTIGDMDEYTTVEKEIENLKNYVLINNYRYGDKVQVEYFVTFGCEECRLPKMILQPFVENAFFHAFPADRGGNITVLVRMMGKNLQIQVIDDGVGIEQKRLRELAEGNTKSEHFTGIGVNNVDDRLKLIYGGAYGIDVKSEEGCGTTITILLPAKFKDEENMAE